MRSDVNKIMYMTSYKMQAEESMRRIDMILTSKQQPEPAIPQYPDTYEVAFEDVTFAYDNTDHPAVSHLTFMAKAGAITALVGHSGSGKSTAASLIPRFYDVQDGAVKIGGVDIREIPQGDLMKMVAFVFQDPKLFKDSLLENIRAGRPSATREEVLKAAHLAAVRRHTEKASKRNRYNYWKSRYIPVRGRNTAHFYCPRYFKRCSYCSF